MPTPRNSSLDVMRRVFAIDLRSLAVFRIALALVLLYDLVDRSRNLRLLFTDAGIMPAELVPRLVGTGAQLSLHTWASGSVAAVAMLFAISFVASVSLLLGYRTRIATLVCWVLLAGLHLRNPWLAYMGGDKYVRIMLFWSLFLPLGARFSIDARRNPELADTSNDHFSIPSIAFVLQIFALYWLTGYQKSGESWWDGTAVSRALQLEYHVTSVGIWLRQFDSILPFFTHATRWFEMGAPFLLLATGSMPRIRTLVIASLVFFHLSLSICLDIGIFPFASISPLLGLLPAWWWDTALPRLRGAAPPEEASTPRPLVTPRWAQGIAAVSLVYVLLHLLPKATPIPGPLIPGPLQTYGQVLRIHQTWKMFAPDAPTTEDFLLLEGQTVDDRRIDLFSEKEIRGEPAPETRGRCTSWRLCQYTASLSSMKEESPHYRAFHESFATAFCADWNARHDAADRLARVRATRLRIIHVPPQTPIETKLFDHTCAPTPDAGGASSADSKKGDRRSHGTVSWYAWPPRVEFPLDQGSSFLSAPEMPLSGPVTSPL